MKDTGIIRLQKDKANNNENLDAFIWTDDSYLNKPVSLENFSDSKEYDISDVIYDGTVLKANVRIPEQEFSRPEFPGTTLVDSDRDFITVNFEKDGEYYLVVSQNALNYLLDEQAPDNISGGQATRFYRWRESTDSYEFLYEDGNLTFNSLSYWHAEGEVWISGGQAENRHGFPTENKIYRFTEDSLEEVIGFDYTTELKYLKVGVRDFLIGYGDDNQQIKLFRFNAKNRAIINVANWTRLTEERYVEVDFMTIDSQTFMFVLVTNKLTGHTELRRYRFADYLISFNLEESIVIEDECHTLRTVDIDGEYRIVVSTGSGTIQTFLYTTREGLVYENDAKYLFDDEGTEIDLRGLIYDLEIFEQDVNVYMLVPVNEDMNGKYDTKSFVAKWDARVRQWIPESIIDTHGAVTWRSIQTHHERVSFVTNFRNNAGDTSQSEIYAWDEIEKDFKSTLTEVIGGSIWNEDDWEEVTTDVAFVSSHNPGLTYRWDTFILYNGSISHCKVKETKGPFNSEDWETTANDHIIETAVVNGSLRDDDGNNKWARGNILIQIVG